VKLRGSVVSDGRAHYPTAHRHGTMNSMATTLHGVEIPRTEIKQFCERNHIRKLSLFGSILTDGFQSSSDVDMLVEFDKGHVPGFLGMAEMELELSGFLGRKVDLRTAAE
jgi:predicted nucleotidyltransferase